MTTECTLVKLFYNLENFFQRYIEGFFDKKFSSGLQPIEIAKQIVRKMENDRCVGVRHVYVSNQYTVYTNKEDYDRLNPYWKTISEELVSYVASKATQTGYTLVGRPMIDLYLDEELMAGKFRVDSKFTEPLPLEDDKTEDAALEAPLSDTREYKKIDIPAAQRFHLTGILTVIEGIDAGMIKDTGVNRTNIGRREGNEMPLTDMNTSRLHAYIVFEEGNHVIYDAKSLNGTYVNGHRITRKRLTDGDRIKLGNTTILYEVK
jgi:hypothetical protein